MEYNEFRKKALLGNVPFGLLPQNLLEAFYADVSRKPFTDRNNQSYQTKKRRIFQDGRWVNTTDKEDLYQENQPQQAVPV
jgi:hypothetical protein